MEAQGRSNRKVVVTTEWRGRRDRKGLGTHMEMLEAFRELR